MALSGGVKGKARTGGGHPAGGQCKRGASRPGSLRMQPEDWQCWKMHGEVCFSLLSGRRRPFAGPAGARSPPKAACGSIQGGGQASREEAFSGQQPAMQPATLPTGTAPAAQPHSTTNCIQAALHQQMGQASAAAAIPGKGSRQQCRGQRAAVGGPASTHDPRKVFPVRTMKERTAQAAGFDLNTASMPRSSTSPASSW